MTAWVLAAEAVKDLERLVDFLLETAPDAAAATGEVILTAKSAGTRASYDWQKSTDGTTWTDEPSTLTAKTTVSGLTVDVRTYFRFRAILPSGTGSWSAAVSIVVQ